MGRNQTRLPGRTTGASTMNDWIIKEVGGNRVWHKDSKEAVEEAIEEFGDVMDLEVESPSDKEAAHITDDETVVLQGGNAEPTAQPVEAEPVETVASTDKDENQAATDTAASEGVPKQLSHNPIDFLRDVNDEFVNVISGKPAISKQGFRFIQREFGITTESELVHWSDDPLGCVVWAKASLPDGHSAEAHGEGYQFESDLRDNEFVRYADTRSKNRALSDLTSAGALAVSELQGEDDG